MSLERQARDALERDDLLAATQAAKAIVLQDRDAPAGYFLLGIAAEQAGQIDNAVMLFDAAVQRGPQAEHLAQQARLLSACRCTHAGYDRVRPDPAGRPRRRPWSVYRGGGP